MLANQKRMQICKCVQEIEGATKTEPSEHMSVRKEKM